MKKGSMMALSSEWRCNFWMYFFIILWKNYLRLSEVKSEMSRSCLNLKLPDNNECIYSRIS